MGAKRLEWCGSKHIVKQALKKLEPALSTGQNVLRTLLEHIGHNSAQFK
jgi:hypothetical protein